MDDLFNLVLAACGNPTRGFAFSHHKRPSIKKHVDGTALQTRQSLIGAQKFYVCDSLLEHAVHASLVRPEILLDMMEVGVPPFDNMWVEWNDRKRVPLLFDAMQNLGWDTAERQPDAWQQRVGLHIQRQADGAYDVDQYTIMNDSGLSAEEKSLSGKIITPPFSLQWRPDAPISVNDAQVFSQGGASSDDVKSFQYHWGPYLFSGAYCVNHEESGGARTKRFTDLFDRVLMTHNSLGGGDVMHYMTMRNSGSPADRAEGDEALKRLQENALKMWTGDIRFLIGVLALLNYPHTIIERRMEKGLKRVAYGRSVPRNELRVLEIDLPKPRGTTRYERMFKGGGGKKRRHVRRGHWRRHKLTDGSIITRWIKEQWVGSAEVGTIIHDYELKSKGTK
jgi:hypothetical protein